MSTHGGSVRSFELGGPATAGRRWAARCNCGALATTDRWSDALGFLTDHLRRSSRPRAVWSAARPFPDLRRADCWLPVVAASNGQNGNGRHGSGRAPRVVIFHRRVVRLVSTALRVALGLPLAARG